VSKSSVVGKRRPKAVVGRLASRLNTPKAR